MAKTNGKKTNRWESDLRFIPCQVQPGMFREEWLVFVQAINPDDPTQTVRVQLFADAREVSGVEGEPKHKQPVPAWLRVSLVRKKNGFAHVILPQPSTPIGEDILVDGKLVKRRISE